jgi:hypothetical protein
LIFSIFCGYCRGQKNHPGTRLNHSFYFVFIKLSYGSALQNGFNFMLSDHFAFCTVDQIVAPGYGEPTHQLPEGLQDSGRVPAQLQRQDSSLETVRKQAGVKTPAGASAEKDEDAEKESK